MSRIQPDEVAERQLAGLLIGFPDAREEILDSVTAEMFATPVGSAVYSAVCDLTVDGIDITITTVAERLSRNISNSRSLVIELQDEAYTPSVVKHYLARVKENFQRRQLLSRLTQFQRRVLDGHLTPKEYADLEDELLSVRSESAKTERPFVAAAGMVRQGRESGGFGFSWGLPKLDGITRGIIPGNYYAIGALKKTGKTLFGVSVTSELACRQKVGCYVFSLEMSAIGIALSYLSRESGIDSANLCTANMSKSQIDEIEALAEQIELTWPLQIDDRKGLTAEQIIAAIRRQARRGVKVFLLDYLQRVCFETARGENRATAIQEACSRLADAAKKYNVALLVLSQLANKAESKKKRPTGKDFKESGGIAEACDCAIILHNVDRVEGNHTKAKRTNKFEIIVDYQRVGQSGRKVTCRHDLSTAHFYEPNEPLPLEPMRTG